MVVRDGLQLRWPTVARRQRSVPFEQIRDWGWTQFIHPDDVAENVRVWQHSVDTGEPFQFEHRFRRADGEYRWHLSRAVRSGTVAGKS